VVNAGATLGRRVPRICILIRDDYLAMRNNPIPISYFPIPTPLSPHAQQPRVRLRATSAWPMRVGSTKRSLPARTFLSENMAVKILSESKARLAVGRPTALISATIRAQSSVPEAP